MIDTDNLHYDEDDSSDNSSESSDFLNERGNLNRRNRRKPHVYTNLEEVGRLKDLYDSGMTQKEIAKRLNYSKSKVGYMIREYKRTGDIVPSL